MHRHIFFLFSILTILGLSFGDSASQAQPASPYTSLNILYIVDQSGSMNGAFTSATGASDPQNLRFVAAQYAVDWLSDFRRTLVVEDSSARPDINISVVYFGTDPVPVLDWTSINTDNPAWESNLQERLRDDLSVERFGIDRHLTDTDFNAAFSQSESNLLRAGQLPTVGGNPLNAVVVITDGGPCTRRDGGFLFQDGETTRYTCSTDNTVGVDVLGTQQLRLTRLQGFVNNNLPADDFRYYLIALDADDEYWSDLQSEWVSIICDSTDPVPDASDCNNLHAVRVQTPIEMGSQMNLVLTDIAQQVAETAPLQPCILRPPQNECTVPPYTQLMRINIYKTEATPLGNQIEIRKPSSEILTPLNPQRAETPIESYVITNPVADTWQINLTNNASVVQIVVDFIPAGVRVQSISDIQVFEQQDLVLEIVDGAGAILDIDPSYPVQMFAQAYDATLPDVDLRPAVGGTIPLTPLGNTFTGSWIPRNTGKFEIRVSAVYQQPDGTSIEFIEDRSVLDNIEVIGTTVDWSSGGITPISTRIDRPISVRGITRNSETGDPVLNTSAMQVRIIATDLNDPSNIQTDIVPNEANANPEAGLVEANLLIAQAGNYQVNAEVGIPDPVTGDFIPLAPAAPLQFVTVNALVPLRVQILQPEEDLFAQSLSLSPLNFDFSTDTPIQVQVTDINNQTVSLASATGNLITRPTVILNPESDNIDYTSQLQELRPGVYSLIVADMSMGSYNLVASVDTSVALVDNYTWQSTTSTKDFNRLLNPIIPIILGTLIAVIVLGAVIFIWFYNRRQRKRANPLKGSLTLAIRYPNGQIEDVDQINLEDEEANEQLFTKLRAPYRRLKLSTHNNPKMSEAGNLYIDEAEFTNGASLSRPMRVNATGEYKDLGTSEENDMAYIVRLSARAQGTSGGSGLGVLRSDE